MAGPGRDHKRGESWYNAKLPSCMIKLESVSGQKLLKECTLKSLSMIRSFVKQRNRTLCGPCSLSIIGNALGLGSELLGCLGKLDESNLINHERVRNFAHEIKLTHHGATLRQMAYFAGKLGFDVSLYHVGEETRVLKNGEKIGNCLDVAQFKEVVKNAFDSNLFLILNYHMGTLGYVDCGGHFSPVGACSERDNRLLVLDTWPETPPAWVEAGDIFKAMSTIDPVSMQPRGFIVLKHLGGK